MFDSMAYAKKLKAVGVPEKHAEAYAEVLADFASDLILRRLADILDEIKTIRAYLEARLK
ncbi:MAG: hypothetical protein M0Z61_03640 [Nitrospiraceae bacterium]|nr:hypothetical protein [Nitrospiraceae bacterium]